MWVALVAVMALARPGRRSARVVAVVAAVACAVFALVASLSWNLVRWDQIALWSVTVSSDTRGLWFPAFSDEVRFVLIDGAEVGPSTFARWVLVHLAAPLLAIVALGVRWFAARAQAADATGTSKLRRTSDA